MEWDGEGLAMTDVLRPGPKFASGHLFWVAGTPRLADFIGPESLFIFYLLDQGPQDLPWPALPVDEWENHESYRVFKDYVKAKIVVNDPAERALRLIKPVVKKFRLEENLQAAMKVTKKARKSWPTGAVMGRKRKNMNKKGLSKIKPSVLLD